MAEHPARAAPERRCLATGARAPKGELLRFVTSPAGELVFDSAQRLPGRGHYLAPSPEAFRHKRLAGLFARSAGQPVAVPSDLLVRVRAGLRQRALDDLGLAQRAGLVTAGYEKVRERLRAEPAKGPVTVLLEASDGAPGGLAKLARLAEAARPGCRRIRLFEAEALGRAIGRPPQVHLTLAPHAIADRFVATCDRFRALDVTAFRDA